MSETSNFKLIIEDDEGRRSVVPVELGEVSVGRQEGNTIRLNERNVSRRHARFVRDNGHVFAEDLDSYNGVWINGDRIKGRQPVHDGDMIRIGDFQLELRGEGLQRRTEETTQRTVLTENPSEVTRPNIRLEDTLPGLPGLAPVNGAAEANGGASNGASHAGVSGQSKVDITRFESGALPVPASARPTIQNPTLDDDGPRPEPTALIRMEQLEEGARKSGSSAIAGQKAKLICVSTQFAGNEFEIDKTEVVIGRTNENDIAVDHRSVSRHHAKIVVSGRAFRIMDLKSANGTLVNGEEYAQIELKKGDLVELGHVKFRFVPAGEVYDFTADELAAMKSSGTTTGRTQIGSSDDDGDAISTRRRQRTNKPMVLSIASAAAVVIIGGVFIATRGDNGAHSEDPPPSTGGGPGAALSQNDMLMRAATMLAQKQWREAQRHAEAYLVLDPSNAQATSIAHKAREEVAAQDALDRAVSAIEGRQWTEATRLLSSISETTSAYEEASKYKSQVREAAVRELMDRGSRSLEERNWQQAIQDMNELERITGPSSDTQRIRLAAQEGEQRGDEMAAAPGQPGRDKGIRNPPMKQAKTTPPPQNPVVPPPGPPPTVKPPPTPTPTPPPTNVAPPVDAKTYYAQAVAALQQQENERAIELLEKCVKADPKLGGCYRALGIAYARQKNGPKAARYYRLYLRVMPNAPDAKQVEELLKSYEAPAP